MMITDTRRSDYMRVQLRNSGETTKMAEKQRYKGIQ